MVNLILNTQVDIKALWNAQHEEGTTQLFSHQPTPIQEMVDGSWLLILNDKDEFDAIELAIELQGDVQIIGTYNMDGTQYRWSKPKRNHTIHKYHLKLNQHPVWNETTQEYEDVDYTEAEAANVQVLQIYGWGNRVLI